MKKYISSCLFIILLISVACRKEWSEPDIYTTNLSLYFTPDSVDANNVYYYSDGMKLQIRLMVSGNGETIKNQVWKNTDNFHWGDSLKNVSVNGSVVSLSDTSYHISDYPVIMRVYKNGDVLFEQAGAENAYSL